MNEGGTRLIFPTVFSKVNRQASRALAKIDEFFQKLRRLAYPR
jgi:hypothetical protein